MKFIDVKGTTQENIAKEVEEVAKRRGMELNFQVFHMHNIRLCHLKRSSKDIWKFRSRLVRGKQPVLKFCSL